MEKDLYPEYYRKNADSVKGSNLETPEPFHLGLIEEIIDSSSELQVKVRKLYRPENTHLGMTKSYHYDLNMLYWSEEELVIPFSKVAGKCYIAYNDTIDMGRDWSKGGPHRYYFTQMYDAKAKAFCDVTCNAKKVGQPGKGKGKGKAKSSKPEVSNDLAPNWSPVSKPLQCMDVFAGCGGLSEGLHQSGIANTCWAVSIKSIK